MGLAGINNGQVLMDRGLFFKYPGDLFKAFELLNKHRIASNVLDPKVAVVYEEVQAHQRVYEPYREWMNPDKVVSKIVKQKTLSKLASYSYVKAMRYSDSWEVILKMDVSSCIFNHLVERYGKKEANKRMRRGRGKEGQLRGSLQGDYHYEFGLFFLTPQDMEDAQEILSELSELDFVSLDVDTALTSFHLQQHLKEIEIESFDILEVAQTLSKGRKWWKSSLNSFTKPFIKKEVEIIMKQFATGLDLSNHQVGD